MPVGTGDLLRINHEFFFPSKPAASSDAFLVDGSVVVDPGRHVLGLPRLDVHDRQPGGQRALEVLQE